MLEKANVPFAPLRRPDRCCNDPHLNETGQLLPTPMENGRIGNLPKLPFTSSEYDFEIKRKAPGLASTPCEVLRETGLDAAQIDALFAAKVVA